MATFSSTKCEALAMLYLRNQDLSNLTPEEIADKYEEAYRKIRKQDSRNNSAKLNTNISGGI